jgi:hypothetical protein
MRFTLQHILGVLLVCLCFVVANVLLGTTVGLAQGSTITIVCFTAAVWALWRCRKRHPDALLAPFRPFFLSMARFMLVALLAGFIFGSHRYEVCTRTRATAVTRDIWLLRWRTAAVPTPESQVIVEELHFPAGEHNWVPTVDYSMLGIGDWLPSFRYPALNLEVDDLRGLAALDPPEQCHGLFRLDNPLDCQFASARDNVLLVLKWRLGKNGGTREEGADAEIVRRWWREHEPLLRPLRDKEDLRKSLQDYHATPRNDYLDQTMQEYLAR